MSCPRCGLNIRLASMSRCPQCGQPLHAPVDPTSRITKVTSESEIQGRGTALDSAVWPDLTLPSSGQQSINETRSSTMYRPPRQLVVPLLPPVSRRSSTRFRVAGAVALALAVVTMATLFLAILHAHDSDPVKSVTRQTQHPTATSAPTLTPRPTGTPRPTTVTPPTIATPAGATPQPTAEATNTTTPQLTTTFFDPLTSNTNSWPDQDGCSIQSDGYHVSAGAQCLAPVTAADTVNISVQMKGVGWMFGGSGIGFRIPSGQTSQQYTFYIYANGTCAAQDLATGTSFFKTTCSSVQQGANAVNTLSINQSGAHMDFYVNGTLVGSADDGTLGAGGIALESQTILPVIFTNFTLTTLK